MKNLLKLKQLLEFNCNTAIKFSCLNDGISNKNGSCACKSGFTGQMCSIGNYLLKLLILF